MKELSLPGDVADEHPVAVLVLVRGHVLRPVHCVHQLPLVVGELPCAPSRQSTLISWNAQPNRAKCCCGNQKLARQRGVVLTDVEIGEELVLERAPRTRL